MKRAILVALAAFGATLAVVLGLRLETPSLAVVVGILCGILAGLPVSATLLFLLWRERRERERLEQRRAEERPAATAPVVILNAGRALDMLPGAPGGFPAWTPAGQAQGREFTIVGEEDMP